MGKHYRSNPEGKKARRRHKSVLENRILTQFKRERAAYDEFEKEELPDDPFPLWTMDDSKEGFGSRAKFRERNQ